MPNPVSSAVRAELVENPENNPKKTREEARIPIVYPERPNDAVVPLTITLTSVTVMICYGPAAVGMLYRIAMRICEIASDVLYSES